MASAGLALSQSSQLLDSEKFSIPISDYLALDAYSCTKPHNLKIASLQKGLVVVCNGTERIGEGAGFGFPVVVCPKESYFSGSATVSLSKTSQAITVRKEFVMDRTDRNKVGNMRLENKRTTAL